MVVLIVFPACDQKRDDRHATESEPAGTEQVKTEQEIKPPLKTAESPQENPAVQLANQYQQDVAEFMAKIETIPDEEKQSFVQNYPRPEQYVERMIKIANETKDSAVAEPAHLWLVRYSGGNDQVRENAIEYLLSSSIESDDLGGVCRALEWTTSAKTLPRLNSVITRSPHRSVKAQAHISKARYLSNLRGYLGLRDNPVLVSEVGAEGVKFIQELTLTKEELSKRIEAEYQAVVDDYPEATSEDDMGQVVNLGDLARAELFSIRNLAIGCTAPEIEGVDLEGQRFKLSDYRGKVVLLEFWGDW